MIVIKFRKARHRCANRFDRAAVMRRAHADFRFWREAGEPKSFGECLRTAWAVAHHARQIGSNKFQLAA